MIAYVKGELVTKYEDTVVIDIGNVGVNVRVSERVMMDLPAYGTNVMLFTYTYVKEDTFSLFGFSSQEELELFKKILQVNGIGPKGALAILSLLPVAELKIAIATGDSKTISKASGIGAKTAQRLILDLKDKIDLEETIYEMSGASSAGGTAGKLTAEKQDAIAALVALGYSQAESTKAVTQISDEEASDADAILKAALKYLF